MYGRHKCFRLTVLTWATDNMCHRQVQCARHGCGHEEPIGEAKVSYTQCIRNTFGVTDCITERWTVSPLNADTVRHIHEAALLALIHVLNGLLRNICGVSTTDCSLSHYSMGRAQNIVVRNGNPKCCHCIRQNI